MINRVLPHRASTTGIPASEVADQVVAAITSRQFWILTHEEMRQGPVERMQRAAAGINPTLNIGRTDRTSMGTSTSSFGVGKRESHDSSDFYARFAAPEITDDTEIGERGDVDVIHVGDARTMSKVPDASVALVVTSPPYFAGKQYETALGEGHVPGDYIEYLTMLRDVLAECVRTLEPGGRIAINVANLGRRPYRSLAADVTTILQDDLRLLLRGEVIWQKQRGASGSCAWGSYQSPANPVLRDTTERVDHRQQGSVRPRRARFGRSRRTRCGDDPR